MEITAEIKADKHAYLECKTNELYFYLSLGDYKMTFRDDEPEKQVLWVIFMFDWLELAYRTLRDEDRERIESATKQYYTPYFSGFYYETESEYYELKNRILRSKVRSYCKFKRHRDFDKKVMMPIYKIMLERFQEALSHKKPKTLAVIESVLKREPISTATQ